MNRIAAVLAAVVLVACVSCAHGAQITITGHAPLFDNDGACSSPSLVAQPPTNPNLRVVLSWSGPSAGRDSLFVQPGAPFAFTKTLTPGTYAFRMYAVDAGGVGCDTTITRVLKAPPFRPTID